MKAHVKSVLILTAIFTHCALGRPNNPINASQNRVTIAITSFAAKSLGLDAEESISSALTTELLNTGKVRVLEREQVDRILKEQGFQQSGACDSTECGVEIGKLLSVDNIIIGRIGKVGNTFTVTARLVNVQTGEIITSTTKKHKIRYRCCFN